MTASIDYESQLKEEVKTWNIEDDQKRLEKFTRERIRHPKLIKDLLLDQLPTHTYDILEVGGGPEPVSDLLQFRSRIVIDPCTDEYKKFFPCPDHINMTIENAEILTWNRKRDLIISTNALDHVENVQQALANISSLSKPGGYVALMCAENNALTNPHPCHEHNLTLEYIHQMYDHKFETCWELSYSKDNYRYGWAEYEGKIGQPAWAWLGRNVKGYS